MTEQRTEGAPQHVMAPRVEPTAVEALTRADIDVQIATAHRYPRSIAKCRSAAESMACVDEETAESCFYSIPREGKQIVGPSVRLGEIIASSWTNLRVATRFIGESQTHVTTQAVCHDLETNVAIAKEVRRKITTKNGTRYSEDMVMMTANAAASIALRNAVFAVVPRAHWKPIFDAAMKTAAGTERTLATRRGGMFAWFLKRGIPEPVLLKLLGKTAVDDIGLGEMNAAQGMRTALSDGDTTVDELIASVTEATGKSTEEMLEADMRKAPTDDNKPPRVINSVPEAVQEPADVTAARELDTVRRKVLGMWANLPADKRANVVKSVMGLEALSVEKTLATTTDIGLLQAVLETIPGA